MIHVPPSSCNLTHRLIIKSPLLPVLCNTFASQIRLHSFVISALDTSLSFMAVSDPNCPTISATAADHYISSVSRFEYPAQP